MGVCSSEILIFLKHYLKNGLLKIQRDTQASFCIKDIVSLDRALVTFESLKGYINVAICL